MVENSLRKNHLLSGPLARSRRSDVPTTSLVARCGRCIVVRAIVVASTITIVANTATQSSLYTHTRTHALQRPLHVVMEPEPRTRPQSTSREMDQDALSLLSGPNHESHESHENAYQAHDSASVVVESRRKIGTWGVVLLTFFNVSGGPWGSEKIVSTAGPLPGFICLLTMVVLWALPMTLLSAELSAAMPSNGGYVLWVDMAFGPVWAFQESFWSLASCAIDNALYPVLAYETLVALSQGNATHPVDSHIIEQSHTVVFAYLSKLGIALVFSIPALFGKVDWMTKLMGVIIVALSMPFVIMLPYILATQPLEWSHLMEVRAAEHVDWVGLIHVTFWNLNGFDSSSTCAGEVIRPSQAFPRGLLLALALIVCMTALPLVVATASNQPPWQLWGEGWWSAIAQQSAGEGFAYAIVVSSLLGTFGMHCAVLWEDAWQLYGMAEQNLAPQFLARRSKRFDNPYNAILVCLIIVLVLIVFDFRSMVIVDNFFSVSSRLLVLFSYGYLKIYRPDLPRPYTVPCMTNSLCLVGFLVSPVLVGLFILLSSFEDEWFFGLILCPVLLLGWCIPRFYRKDEMSAHVLTAQALGWRQEYVSNQNHERPSVVWVHEGSGEWVAAAQEESQRG